jgi:uncharacterized caspase-like protein
LFVLRPSRRAIVIGGSLVIAGASRAAFAQQNRAQLALIIGNSYEGAAVPALSNARADARLVAAALREVGVRETLIEDVDHATLTEAVTAFTNSLRRQDTAILYYAGHGVQLAGQNYLLMQDGETLVPAVPLVQQIREQARSTIILLDACRDNPFANEDPATAAGRSLNISGVTRSARSIQPEPLTDLNNGRGLARMSLRGSGVRLVFATEADNVALDTVGGAANGPFAGAFAARVRERVSFDEVISNVTRDVREATNNAQSPWQQGSLEETIYLAGEPPRERTTVPFNIPG